MIETWLEKPPQALDSTIEVKVSVDRSNLGARLRGIVESSIPAFQPATVRKSDLVR